MGLFVLRLFRLILVVFCLFSCTHSTRGKLRIGIDPNWYSANFGTQVPYVNGYTEDTLLEIARYSGMQFELVRANWDSLLDGMKEGKYDAILSLLPLHEYNLAKYDFSESLLDLGPVLIIPRNSNQTDLKKLEGDLVGIIANDPAELILANYPTLIVRHYSTIPDLLNALSVGDIQGALLNQIPAINYISDIYAGILQIAGKPLTNEAIRLVGPKERVDQFNNYLVSLRKKNKLEKLKKKWELLPL